MHPIQPAQFAPLMLAPLLLTIIFLAMMVVFFFVAVAGTIFWVCMLIDCVQNEPSTGNDKIVWLLLLIFTHFIGALIYYFVRCKPRKRQLAGLPPIPSSSV